MFDQLDDKEIDTVIYNQLIGCLGCHADGETYIVPISYAYDGQSLYCRSHKGRKIDMMRKNPKVCFQIDDTRNLSNWKSVICWGLFEELVSKEERQEAIQQLSKRVLPSVASQTMKLSTTWPFTNGTANEVDGILFKIKLIKKTGKCEVTASQLYVGT